MLKLTQEVCFLNENRNKFLCAFNGKRLFELESIFEIINSNYTSLNNVNFFEFGAQQWNPTHYGPRSGVNSHFMCVNNFSYKCFDPYSEPEDFEIIGNLFHLYGELKDSWISKKYGSHFLEAIEKFNFLEEKKDLSKVFIRTRSERYYSEFFNLYMDLDLNNLKEKISKCSISEYTEIEKIINNTKNSVVYSQNVLNAPNLSKDFNFWNIKNSFHVHYGSMEELADNLDVFLDWKFKSSGGKVFSNKIEFLDSFKNNFNLKDFKINLFNDRHRYFLFWNTKN